jgi:prepilin peptidase CpaA
MSQVLSSAIVLVLGVPAVWVDIRSHRIPNLLVGVTLVAAFAVQFMLNGVLGLGLALGGAALGLLALLPLHLMRALGAGDVKLMAAFGALLGPLNTVLALAFTLIAGAVLAVATLGWRRWSAATVPAGEVRHAGLAGQLPYAGAIVAGTLTATLIGA